MDLNTYSCKYPEEVTLVENNSQLADKNSKEFWYTFKKRQKKNCLLLACLFNTKRLNQTPQYPSWAHWHFWCQWQWLGPFTSNQYCSAEKYIYLNSSDDMHILDIAMAASDLRAYMEKAVWTRLEHKSIPELEVFVLNVKILISPPVCFFLQTEGQWYSHVHKKKYPSEVLRTGLVTICLRRE